MVWWCFAWRGLRRCGRYGGGALFGGGFAFVALIFIVIGATLAYPWWALGIALYIAAVCAYHFYQQVTATRQEAGRPSSGERPASNPANPAEWSDRR
jgi:hypothetical protein